jgi:hypothetical protein
LGKTYHLLGASLLACYCQSVSKLTGGLGLACTAAKAAEEKIEIWP